VSDEVIAKNEGTDLHLCCSIMDPHIGLTADRIVSTNELRDISEDVSIATLLVSASLMR